MHFYNPNTETTNVSWSYRDSSELEYFVLEVWDEVARRWVPYDNLMGVIPKEGR